MSIPLTVESYLRRHQVPFEVLMHTHTQSSLRTAESARIPRERLAKAVMLQDERGYLMAVLPAAYRIDLPAIREHLGRKVDLAGEAGFGKLFGDCELGAVPPLGPAYGIETVVDDTLLRQDDIYFEAGDHEEVIHVGREHFARLLGPAQHGRFCRPA